MFDVSWGELAVVGGLGLALIGRQDLPQAARVAGTQVGRLVGLLQGARARADRFTANHELKQLQNELRAGLRELDAAKAEMAVSMSASGMMGRTLGPTVASANRNTIMNQQQRPQQQRIGATVSSGATSFSSESVRPNISATAATNPASTPPSMEGTTTAAAASTTQPHFRRHGHETMIAAVAEEEWRKQGIEYISRAEQGAGVSHHMMDVTQSGSATLSNILRQSLVFDQYDRVVEEQDKALQSKMDSIQKKKNTSDGDDK